MSNLKPVENVKQIVQTVEPDFNQLAEIHKAVNWKRESSFALQILNDNSFLMQTAVNNPDSLKRAIINVAAIGLSLNPVEKLAYLVPRDKKVCLDISYRGYLKLAADIGSIKWAVAELVYEKDEYVFRGVGREPVHNFNPFSGERGKIVGCYVLAKTHTDEFILTQMSAEEVFAIRNRSQSWKSHIKEGKSTPWKTDEGQMIKKTVIKRASNDWPRTDTRARLEKALDVSNEADPVELATTSVALPPAAPDLRGHDVERIRDLIKKVERTEEAFLNHLQRTHRREIKSLEELTMIELTQAIAYLTQMAEAQPKKGAQ